MKPKVYIAQLPSWMDCSDATRYGELYNMGIKSVFADDVERSVLMFQREISDKMASFNAAEDYLILVGDVSVMFMMCLEAQARANRDGLTHIRLLKYDRLHRFYYVIPVPIKPIGDDHESQDTTSTTCPR